MSDAINPAQAFGSMYQVGQALGQTLNRPAEIAAAQQSQFVAQQAAEQAAEFERQRVEAAKKAFSPGATADDMRSYFMFVKPAEAEQLTKAMGAVDTAVAKETNLMAGEIITAIKSGRPDIAKSMLETRREQLKNSGKPTAMIDTQLQMLETDPNAVLSGMQTILAFSPGGDEIIKSINAQGEEARAIGSYEFDLNKTKAETRKINAEAKKLEFENTMAELENLNPTVVIPDSMKNRQGVAVDKSLSNGITAKQADSLATLIEGLPKNKTTGLIDVASEAVKKALGRQDAFTIIKANFNKLTMKDVLEGLPPGPATDRDIEIAMKGTIPDNANPATMASYLRGIQKIAQYKANLARAEAEWIANVGSMNTAGKDFTVMGIQVPKGKTYIDFANENIKLGEPPKSGAKTGGTNGTTGATIKVQPGTVLEGDD